MDFLVRGIQYEFRVGYDQKRARLVERRGAVYEASQHREVIENYLEKEGKSGRVVNVSQE